MLEAILEANMMEKSPSDIETAIEIVQELQELRWRPLLHDALKVIKGHEEHGGTVEA